MFCYQCEQTAGGKGCTRMGICGKSPEVAALHDLLVHSLRGLSLCAVEGRKKGIHDKEAGPHTCDALFATLTNVEFDPERLRALVWKSLALRDAMKGRVQAAGGTIDSKEDAVVFRAADTLQGMVEQGRKVGLEPESGWDPDIRSLQHILLFGLKGLCAYTAHARDLGQEDENLYVFAHEALAATGNRTLPTDQLLGMVLKCGEMNLRALELLDAGNTGTYGHPVPTQVPLGARKGKAILVSGHDLIDLEKILQLSEGKGISVYTHGEMLPTHGYPGLKKYAHFYGHYGTAWQNQQAEFARFPGSILMTTNCLQNPRSYEKNLFTCGMVGWPGIPHLSDRAFEPVIERALQLPGYRDDVPGKTVNVGFARNSVLGAADKIVHGVKEKKIRHFFLVAGCDGAKAGRNYYTRFVEAVPEDCLVLTLACGKFRFFDKDLGTLEGLPRLLDVGQCNDSYSAVRIAMALANAFDCGVNDLPLSFILSWYEQKAVAILLSLFHLGVKGIRLGPSLPAFITPNVLSVLVKNYDIGPIAAPEEDLKASLGA